MKLKKNKHKKTYKGFTLSEVLISLVIIGVIAAITVPAVIQNYKREEASARVKKFYNMMANASTRAKSDGKSWDYWAESTSATSDSDTGSKDTGKLFVQEYMLPYLVYYKTKQNGTSYYVYLNDGTYFRVYKGGCLDFIIDINGEKKPNIEGKDQFRFLYCSVSNVSWIKNGQIIPYQLKTMTTREKALDYCKNVSGMYCSALLAIDNWEFKKDYPYNI